jgi:hypothetical protein
MKHILIQVTVHWRRRLITLLCSSFVFFSRFTSSRRSRIHWVGRFNRPRRPERVLFFLLFFGSMALLEPVQFIFWAVMWGGTLAIFLNLYMVYWLIPRRRVHWVR